MRGVEVQGDYVAVAPLDHKDDTHQFITVAKDTNSSGVVVGVGANISTPLRFNDVEITPDIHVGQEIFFGNKYHTVDVDGRLIKFMGLENIFATKLKGVTDGS